MKHNDHSYPWVPDLGDGTYRNPVLHADYSDPDVVRVGSDFFLTASSFQCTPGLPILHSRDLVNWRIVNHALKALPDPRYAEVQHGHGVWAPAFRHHDGKFWIVFPTPDEGIYVTTADHPEGDWSEPHLLMAGKGLIDPCPLWDDDGKAYLIHAYAGSRAGIRNKLHVRPMSPDARTILGEGEIVAEIDPALPALEGPKFLKRNGWYYISAPGGGVPTGWQTLFRSRHIYGPYEEKILLAQRGTEVNGPHQGALVDTPTGDWWFLHFQEKQPYGRIVHLQPVRWEADWPLIGEEQDENGVGRPVLRHRMPLACDNPPLVPLDSDEFDQPTLGMQWQWHANASNNWFSLSSRPGRLRLNPRFVKDGVLSNAPNVLLQKFPAPEFSVATRMELPSGHSHLRAGLVVMGERYAALEARREDAGYLVRLMGSGACVGEAVTVTEASDVTLMVRVDNGGLCRFGIATAIASFYQVGPAFQAVPGVWIGAKVGLFCISTVTGVESGHAEFEWFRFRSVMSPSKPELHVVNSQADHENATCSGERMESNPPAVARAKEASR
jgi:beta-xylosidase